ncbi:hypothetical protein HRW18_32845, partial [Streptomyces lunaelactis]|uniref:hypothetical protein n=1 Tax=Streptomyces lunaelactis TaxID=1535768 RepID=UPI0015857B17
MTTKHTEDEPQPAEFAAFLVGHLGGRTHEEIGVELHQLLEAVKAHGKKGSLTITVVIEPPSNGVEGAPLPIGIEYAAKAPKAAAPKNLYFLDDERHKPHDHQAHRRRAPARRVRRIPRRPPRRPHTRRDRRRAP